MAPYKIYMLLAASVRRREEGDISEFYRAAAASAFNYSCPAE